jgi:hypothetical protein
MRYVAIAIAVLCLIAISVSLVISSSEVKSKQTTTDAQKQTKEKGSNTDKQLTPPWWVYVTGVIAGLNFLYTVFFNIYKLIKSRSESIKDKYWFRKILLPICVNPLNEFANKQTTELKAVEEGASDSKIDDGQRIKIYKQFLVKFSDEKSDVINRFMVLLPIQKELYAIVAIKLDELEDSVTEYCMNKSFGTDMGAVSHPGQVIFTSLGEIM